MKKLLSRFFLWLLGWKVDRNIPKETHEKCVMICAPHTSNWDYPIAMACMAIFGVKIRYTIKREWLRPPMGWLVRAMGGIGVDRRPRIEGEQRASMVEAMVRLFEKNEKLCLLIPAEGSRSLRRQWKTGFYYVALQAKVPIVLGWLDYQKKMGGVSKVLYPSGNLEADMYEIMDFFKDIKAKYPQNFAVDERYYPRPERSESRPPSEDEDPTTPQEHEA